MYQLLQGLCTLIQNVCFREINYEGTSALVFSLPLSIYVARILS